VRDTLFRPKREFETCLKIEESDSAVLELGAHDAIGLQAKTVAIKPD
jgi:hypothetical protein